MAEDQKDQKAQQPAVFYEMPHRGSTRGKSGRPYTYEPGDVIEAPEGELDHVGGTKVHEKRPAPAKKK